ncbi:hypothetical protein [Streptomyces sp. RFCAC02]|uniref:hypothetical protein n=1 Tax=Streptomyces sp. RFCAC02 TaxID=2499143 RepID=UPI00101F0B20|nr:hypothetical protein [Streptomyces sp. RFCAC02]
MADSRKRRARGGTLPRALGFLAVGVAAGLVARPSPATTRATTARVLDVVDRAWWWFSQELRIAMDDMAEPLPDPSLQEADDLTLGLAVFSALDRASANHEPTGDT